MKLFIDSFYPNEYQFVNTFNGFHWDGTNDGIKKILRDTVVIDNKIKPFILKNSINGRTLIFNNRVTHKDALSSKHSFFLFDKNKNLISSGSCFNDLVNIHNELASLPV